MEEDKVMLAKKLLETVNEISGITEYRSSVKKQYCNLARRLKLLTPLFEEIRDSKEELPQETLKSLAALNYALDLAKELLRFGCDGSKIFLVSIVCLYSFIMNSLCYFFLVYWRIRRSGKNGEPRRNL